MKKERKTDEALKKAWEDSRLTAGIAADSQVLGSAREHVPGYRRF